MIRRLGLPGSGDARSIATCAALGLAAAVVGIFAYRAFTGGGTPDVALMCMTPGCGTLRERPLELGESLPARCPACDKSSLVPAFTCPQCGTPNIWNEDRGLPPPTKCSKCGKEVRHG